MKTLSIISSIEFTTQSCFHQEVQGLASIEAFLGGDFYSRPDVFSVELYGHDSRLVFFGCKKKMGQFLHGIWNNQWLWVEFPKVNSYENLVLYQNSCSLGRWPKTVVTGIFECWWSPEWSPTKAPRVSQWKLNSSSTWCSSRWWCPLACLVSKPVSRTTV